MAAFDDWDRVTIGHSAAVVRRSPDGRSYVKSATGVERTALAAEHDRLTWLAMTPIGAPRVLDWVDGSDEAGAAVRVSHLVTCALPGVPGSSVPRTDAARAVRGMVELLAALHALSPADCPFDRRLAVTVPLARAAGSPPAVVVDAPILDRVRAAEPADLAVCHGDLCLPNFHLDPGTLRPTGVLDVGRLGVADRHLDLALLHRSMADVRLNPAFGPARARELAEATGADPERLTFYRVLDLYL